MIKFAAIVASAALAVASMAVSAAEPKAPDTARAKPSGDERKICRDGKPTGTRMVTRICKTRAEWNETFANNQRAVDSSMSRSQIEIGREDSQRGF